MSEKEAPVDNPFKHLIYEYNFDAPIVPTKLKYRDNVSKREALKASSLMPANNP